MFLHEIDFEAHQRVSDLGVITNDSTTVRNFAENAATTQIKSHLKQRFDTDAILINVTDWNNAITYNEGAQVVRNSVMYYALQANSNEDPETPNSMFWQMGDLRDSYLVMITVDMTVYHLVAKVARRATPESIIARYQDAIAWLEGVSAGELDPDFPLRSADPANDSNENKWGSDPKKEQRW